MGMRNLKDSCLRVHSNLQVPQVPSDFSGKVTTKSWVAKLHQMPASHELDDADQRQLLFDLESSYNDFMALF